MTTATFTHTENLTVQGPSARFTYRRTGPRGGVPLVLLHRFRATIDWWDPEFVEVLARDRDVIAFDNVGIGYTDGEPATTIEAFAAGTIEFIQSLGLSEVDLLGWSFGGVVAQGVTMARPDLVRKLVVAGSGSGVSPAVPPMTEKVLGLMASPASGNSREDMLFLFYPETPQAQALGHQHFDKVEAATPEGAPAVSEEAAQGQLQATLAALSTPWDSVTEALTTIKQPVLYANGMHDVMIHPMASYSAVEHLPNATLLLYSDAGHAFLFQHLNAFATEVANFLGLPV